VEKFPGVELFQGEEFFGEGGNSENVWERIVGQKKKFVGIRTQRITSDRLGISYELRAVARHCNKDVVHIRISITSII